MMFRLQNRQAGFQANLGKAIMGEAILCQSRLLVEGTFCQKGPIRHFVLHLMLISKRGLKLTIMKYYDIFHLCD
jgi:hypothetical protein